VPHPAYKRVGDPVFSPDGHRVAFWAAEDGKELAVVDGVAG
jgi:hypothetical protein